MNSIRGYQGLRLSSPHKFRAGPPKIVAFPWGTELTASLVEICDESIVSLSVTLARPKFGNQVNSFTFESQTYANCNFLASTPSVKSTLPASGIYMPVF